MCRKEIWCWTTKKLVQLTLDGNTQQVKVGEDKMKKQEKLSMKKLQTRAQESVDEHRQLEEDSFKEESQQEQVSKVAQPDVTGIVSNTTFCQMGEFNSSQNFLYCLRCLAEEKAELSCLEIMLIMVSNLSIFNCKEHAAKFIETANAEDILQGLQHMDHIVRYTFQKLQNAHLTLSSMGFVDHEIIHHCFFKIRTTLETLELFFTDAFPYNGKVIHEQLFVIINIGCEINHLLQLADRNFTCKICDSTDLVTKQ